MKPAATAERSLIESILKRRPARSDSSVLLGPGDDASILQFGKALLAVSVDTFKEGRHFSFEYFSAEQIGAKALQASASDIVAMGGVPRWAWVSIATRVSTDAEVALAVYNGLYDAAESLSMGIEGGETIEDDTGLMLSVTVLGELASPESVCRRSDAEPGDVVCLSGACGASAAGLRLIQKDIQGFESLKRKHLEPVCRSDLIANLTPRAKAMIDVSDGLSSELWHIAAASNVRVTVQSGSIPLPDTLTEASALLKENPLDFALNGGEDFELLYTVSEWDDSLPGVPIGKVSAGEGVFMVDAEENIVPLPAGGYTHGE